MTPGDLIAYFGVYAVTTGTDMGSVSRSKNYKCHKGICRAWMRAFMRQTLLVKRMSKGVDFRVVIKNDFVFGRLLFLLP